MAKITLIPYLEMFGQSMEILFFIQADGFRTSIHPTYTTAQPLS